MAYILTRLEAYETALRHALGWFFSLNAQSVTLYDDSTGACYDGANQEDLNQNQGAESSLAFLLAAATFIETFLNE